MRMGNLMRKWERWSWEQVGRSSQLVKQEDLIHRAVQATEGYFGQTRHKIHWGWLWTLPILASRTFSTSTPSENSLGCSTGWHSNNDVAVFSMVLFLQALDCQAGYRYVWTIMVLGRGKRGRGATSFWLRTGQWQEVISFGRLSLLTSTFCPGDHCLLNPGRPGKQCLSCNQWNTK